MKVFFFSFILIFSCSKKPQEKKVQTVTLNFEGQEGRSYSPDPAAIDEVNCLGVFVTYPEEPITATCSTTPAFSVTPHLIGGHVPVTISGGVLTSGGSLTLEVLTGTAREFHLVGVAVETTELGGCPDISTTHQLIGPYLSHGFILGSVVQDIGFGDNIINIDANFTSGVSPKLQSCSGFMSYWSAFLPTSVDSLALWYDIKDPNTVYNDTTCTTVATTGDDVRCLKDKSGNGLDTTDAGAVTPSFSSTGTPRIIFDGVNEKWDLPFMPTPEGTLFLVFKPETSTGERYLIGSADAGPTQQTGFSADSGTPELRGYWAGAFQGTGYTVATDYFASLSFSGSTYSFYLNGNLVSGGATGGSAPSSTFCLGCLNTNGATSNYYDGSVSEILYYSRKLTIVERKRVERYLKNRWGL